MKRIAFDSQWYFKPVWTDGTWNNQIFEGGQFVTLPHDFSLSTLPAPDSPEGAATGYVNGGAGTYQKLFFAPDEWRGQTVEIELDGAYRLTDVFLNGHHLGLHPNGYMPFFFDLTPYLLFGQENRLTISVNNSLPCSSRWYSGSGIYRHVDLCVSPALGLSHRPLYAFTERLADDEAVVLACVTLVNRTLQAQNAAAQVFLIDDETGAPVAQGSAQAFLPAGGEATARLRLVVTAPRPWSPEHPHLYRLRAEIGDDADETLFGIRTLSVDARHGLRLNGEPILLKGGCVHHTNGILGALALRDAEFARVRKHKELGFNALRCAHNPPSRDFLEACDRLGMMVIDEAFDMWRMAKRSGDYHLFFDAWWREDVRLFMLRDRNHPSVIMWSTGNEVGERNGASGGAQLARELADFMRSLDATRPITNGIASLFNGMDDDHMRQMFAEWGGAYAQNADTRFSLTAWSGLTREFAAALDVCGYNYLAERYERDHAEYPQRVICGTETFPKDIDLTFAQVKRLPHVIGDFTWTSMDYLGEAGVGRAEYGPEEENLAARPIAFPWRSANDADLDLTLHRRAQSHFRSIVWGASETYIAVLAPEKTAQKEWFSRWGWPDVYDEWTFPGYEGQPARVDVYSAAPEVRLYLNGAFLGRAPAGEENRFMARFLVPYAPGTLTAVSMDGDREISRAELHTAGAPCALRLTASRTALPADGQSLCYIDIVLTDENGYVVAGAPRAAHLSLDSASASLAAFGSANPRTAECYTSGHFTSFHGRWQAIVRAGEQAGPCRVSVQAGDLQASLTLRVE